MQYEPVLRSLRVRARMTSYDAASCENRQTLDGVSRLMHCDLCVDRVFAFDLCIYKVDGLAVLLSFVCFV